MLDKSHIAYIKNIVQLFSSIHSKISSHFFNDASYFFDDAKERFLKLVEHHRAWAYVYIRQIPSAHVISDIYHFRHSIK